MLVVGRLRAVRSSDAALDLFRELGFRGTRTPADPDAIGLEGVRSAIVCRSSASKRRGSAVVVLEADDAPRSLRRMARSLREQIHDRPVGLLLVGPPGDAQRAILFRPLVARSGRRDRLSKLEIDIVVPTRHDSEVVWGMRWDVGASDDENQSALDRAMDVERVTTEFFKQFSAQHERLRAALEEMSGSAKVATFIRQADGADRLALHLMTRLLFCWFLQRKGFLAGDRLYLPRRAREVGTRIYQDLLEPLFYDSLRIPVSERPAGAPTDVPFLNGGLFEREDGWTSLPFEDDLFDAEVGFLGFLSRWTFTVAEDVPEEVEVAVDPEMLGKVFEHLISDDDAKKKGVVYTPRDVVHFMCREALVLWMHDHGFDEDEARSFLTDDEAISGIEHGRLARLDRALTGISVLDPAVGSGAFPLGMVTEIVRLRTMIHRAIRGSDPTSSELHAWKLALIEHSVFGVDIESRAIDLCRLRLWLSLIVDAPVDETPLPLPNLDHRTIHADSLADFFHGVPVQDTRRRTEVGMFDSDASGIEQLRSRYVLASSPADKAELARQIDEAENRWRDDLLRELPPSEREELIHHARTAGYFPFMPALAAPSVWKAGGWDIVIMNPPYLGKKEVPQTLPAWRVADYFSHFGEKNDLMILFAQRARELARAGGVVSMIFNDSIFTSVDANGFRDRIFREDDVRVAVRTRCFEQVAVNGGIIVWRRTPRTQAPLRWVENYKRPTLDLSAATEAIPFVSKAGKSQAAGESEVFSAPGEVFRRLPHRPLFRPSSEAIAMTERFLALKDQGPLRSLPDWEIFSKTSALGRRLADLRGSGWFDALAPGDWVPLAYAADVVVGLQTSDDKRFLAAIEGTTEAQRHLACQVRLEAVTRRHARWGSVLEGALAEGKSLEGALLDVWCSASILPREGGLGWPKGAMFRVAPAGDVQRSRLSDEERAGGIDGRVCFVPFEKGSSGDEGTGDDDLGEAAGRLGAKWVRENPIVIDWSKESVALLRERVRTGGRRPYFRNEAIWFSEGVTFNRVASYLRARLLPPCIFGDKAPAVLPLAEWLDLHALLALLNAPVIEFIVRTFLGSRMQIEVGDLRRVPVPVLTADQTSTLSALGRDAVAAKLSGARADLERIEAELDAFTRDLYGIAPDADLWVVR